MVFCSSVFFLEANRATYKLLMAEAMLGSSVLFDVFLDCKFMGNVHWSFFRGVGFKRTFSRFMVLSCLCMKGSSVRICSLQYITMTKERWTLWQHSSFLHHRHSHRLCAAIHPPLSLFLWFCCSEGDWFSVEHDCPGAGVLGAYAFSQSSGKYDLWRVFRAQYLFCTYSRHRAARVRGRLPPE
jgi:hypothetical protein